jgi:dipeptidyl aminopeptidase/acylaminoacyl peptidase
MYHNYLKLIVCFIIISLIITFIVLIHFTTRSNNLIPRNILFGNPDKTTVRLSPNAMYISYLTPKDGGLTLCMISSTDSSKAQFITNIRTNNYSWAFDNQHILYLSDDNGDENDRLYSYNLKTNKSVLLTPKNNVKAKIYKKSRLIPNEILIGLNDRDTRYFDVYKLNLINHTKELVLKNERFNDFIINDNLKILFAILTNEEGDQEYFEQRNGDWELFMKIPMEDTKTTGVIGFDKTGSIAYLLDTRTSNTASLKALNLYNKELTTIAEDMLADIRILTSHPTEKNIQAVIINYDRRTYNILDDSITADIEYLRSINPGDLYILSRSLDDKMWLVAYESDTSPIKYYKYDRSQLKVEFLFASRKDLESYTMSPMTPVIIKSRDGLNLVSYLTLPHSIQKIGGGKMLPLILVVHDGPWNRDNFEFNTVHQWLSNRGYAVLSVNFRGSTGFGKNFINAGNKEWGGKMQDDLIDAVHWAIENKVADPKKICIMGASYGGYAALMGLALTPDIFACGIDIFGPSNILTAISTPYWKSRLNDLKKRIGSYDTKEDREFLEQRSPLTFVDRIKKPLLIVQGANDPRIKKIESDQIVEAMQQRNIPVTYILYNDEGHGFARPKNRLYFYAMAEEFLANILGGKMEPMDKTLKRDNITLTLPSP